MNAVFGKIEESASLATKAAALGWRARLRREPLLLFVLIGILLLGAHRLSGVSAAIDDNPRRIVVDRDTILNFLQYRSKVFSEQGPGQSFDAMSKDERKRLVDDYVREEALYREALSWGLDKQDYVLRRRLVQSIEFALQDDSAAASPDEATLRRFYKANPKLYALSPTVSFAHVYFHSGTDAAARARSALTVIRAGRVDPASIGDRFLYNSVYTGQPFDSVARDFGQKFAAALFADSQARGWIGPVESEHGVHLVHITNSAAGGIQPFENVRGKVAADVAEELRRQRQEAEVRRIAGQYRVAIASGLR